jgi:hypothetical protein
MDASLNPTLRCLLFLDRLVGYLPGAAAPLDYHLSNRTPRYLGAAVSARGEQP